MKFRDVSVYPLVIVAKSEADLEYQISLLDKVYDLQYSTTKDGYEITYSALALIEIEED